MPQENIVSRTRMNFSMNAKGLVQPDITVEYDTPEQAADAARTAIDLFRAVCAEKGLKIVEPAA